ncbi:MAG: sulfatase-like hydrolase/transferase [Candidatus Hydrogenedentes bacterium]|nr:sulfatase-like hydrolase/transferase [Candidatus Hydrogenedentota bacterium]
MNSNTRQTAFHVSRRSFLAATAALVPLAIASGSARKPNVIVILTDDQGSIDAPGFGATDLIMPNLDALGNRGVRFTQFYSAAPVCSPSRAGLLTGKYPLRAGMPNNAPDDETPLPTFAEQTTIADLFKRAGYATAHIGKWHLGMAPDCVPNARGFDYSFGHMNGCIDNYSHFFFWHGPNRHDLTRNGSEVHEDGAFFPDLMVKEATQFIEAHKDRPFFMYFAANAPHYPYQPDEKWLAKYADVPYPRNLYAAFLSTLDERIGRLLACVDACGLRGDTIIVYQSDNGHSMEERAHFGGGSAGAYRGAKFSLFEGGVRVPAIVSWPGHLPEAVTRSQVTHACDWMPTLAALCGIEAPTDIDGCDLSQVIQSAEARSPHNVLHWYVGTGENARWAVRKGDWKLLFKPQDTGLRDAPPIAGELFLVNLRDDICEQKNCAGAHPDVVRELVSLHDAWIKKAAPSD